MDCAPAPSNGRGLYSKISHCKGFLNFFLFFFAFSPGSVNALRPLNKLRAWRWGRFAPAAAARAINSVYAAIGKFIASATATGIGAGRAV